MYRLSIFVMPLVLFGCNAPHANPPQQAGGDIVEASLQPTDVAESGYQASVAAYIKRYFVHADSLRAVKIGEPFSGKLHGRVGSIVCVEMDAKNRAGSYTGLKRTAFLVKDQKVIESDYDSSLCRSQQLAAWPEMDIGSASRAGRRDEVQGSVAKQSAK